MNPREDPVIKLAISAERNHWQCYGRNGFTWLAGADCPDYGSSDCPMTMDEDGPCRMNDEREAELLRYRQVKR